MNEENKPIEQKALVSNRAPQSEDDLEKGQTAVEFEKDNKNGQITMHVKIASPFKDYYDDSAFSISAENLTGPFDILPRHHNFMSLLNPCELVVRSAKDGANHSTRIRISGGLMHVKADAVIVFLDV
jgi:hypothetical protein